MYWIVINLHRRIGIGSSKSHHMVSAIINFGIQVPQCDIFCAQIVIQKQFASVLFEEKWRKFNLISSISISWRIIKIFNKQQSNKCIVACFFFLFFIFTLHKIPRNFLFRTVQFFLKQPVATTHNRNYSNYKVGKKSWFAASFFHE